MSDVFEQVFDVAFNTSGAEGINQARDLLKSLGDTSGISDDQLTGLLTAVQNLGEQSRSLDKFTDSTEKLSQIDEQLVQARAGLAALSEEFAKTDKSSAGVSQAFSDAEAQVRSLSAQHTRLSTVVAQTGAALKASGVDVTNLTQAHATLNTKTADLQKQFDGLAGKVKVTGDSTKDAGDKAKSAATAFEFLKEHLAEIISIATAVEIALKGIEFGGESLTRAEAIETSLARVKALAAGASEEFEGMDEAVEKAARAVNDTSEESASGLAALVGQGLAAKDAIEALVPTLQLAKIANIDVSTAAAEVAQALKAFNLPASDAQKVVDQLTSASHGAAGGLGAMSSAAAALAPDAKAIGLNFTQTVGILGLLESKGLDTEKSLRGLRTIFQDLQDPSSKLRVELFALGDGSADFGKAITALSSNTSPAHDALLTLDGSARSLVKTLGTAGPDALAKFTEGLQKTQGEASKTAQAIDQTLSGAGKRFGNAIDEIGTKLVKPILEPFTDELNKLAGELNAFADSPDFKEIEEAVKVMATNAVAALDKFLHGLDWKSFTADGKAAVKGLSDDFGKLANNAESTARNINKAFSTVGVIYHGVVGTVDAAVGVAATATDKLIGATEGGAVAIASIAGQADLAKLSFEQFHDAAESVADVALADLDAHTTSLSDDLAVLGINQAEAARTTTAHGDAAAAATPKVQAHGDAAAKAGTQAHEFAAALGIVPDYLAKTGDAARTATPLLEKVGDVVSGFAGPTIEEATQRLNAAKQALLDLNRAGNATPAALDAAAQAVRDADKDLKALQGSGTDAAEALKTAFATLKIQSQASLDATAKQFKGAFEVINQGSADTAAGLADRQNAFLAYAKAAIAAASNLDDSHKASAQSELEAQASALGVIDTLKQLEDAGGLAGDSVAAGADRGADGLRREAEEADRTREKLEHVAGSAGAAADAAGGIGDALDGDDARGTGALQGLDGALAGVRQGFLNVSDAAAQLFDKEFSDYGAHISEVMGGLSNVIDQLNAATKVTTEQIAAERAQLKGVTDDINTMATATANSFGKTGALTDAEVDRLRNMSAQIKDGTYQFGILGQSELGPLQEALDAAIQRAEALKQAAQSAAEQLADINDQLQDQIDQQTGNQTDQEDRRYQKQLQQIQDLYKASGDLGSKDYQEAVARANELHELNLKNIQSENDAKNGGDTSTNSTRSGSNQASRSTGSASGGLGGGGDSTNGNGGAAIGGTQDRHTAQITFNNHTYAFDLASAQDVDPLNNFLQELNRAKATSI